MTRQQRAADLLVASGIGWAMRILRRWMLDERGMETVEYAILAGLMVADDIPDAELIVTTVAVAIVVTLALQTTTKVWLGRRLGLDERPPG